MTPQAGDGIPGFSDWDLPLAAGSLTGVRLWQIDLPSYEGMSNGTPGIAGLLTGVFGVAWQPGENVAVCGGGQRPPAGHPAPVPADRCGCGFWAYWTPRDAQRSDYRRADVIGIMQGYGRARIGTRGCRCSKARIAALHVLRVTGEFRSWDLQAKDIAETLGRYYGVPWYESFEEMLAAHPPTADYLPRSRQHLTAVPQRPLAGPAPVRWRRVLAFAAAYVALACLLTALAAGWGQQALVAVITAMVAGAVWPFGTWWLPRWARKLRSDPAGPSPAPAA